MTKLFSFFFLFSTCFKIHGFELERLPDYESHRNRFNAVLADLKNYNIESISWPVLADSSLSTKVAVVQNKTFQPEKILVMSSGIHGVEAYVGSSVQIAFIRKYLSKSQSEYDFAFVHILNPWGMKHNRRVNRDNIDLNRNFLTDRHAFQVKNESYEKIDSFLNPQKALNLHFAQRFLFILDSMYYILRFSIESLRQSILQGQYHWPHGIYYGGAQADPIRGHIDQFVTQKLSAYKEIYWIDLHTGYGERGRLHFLANDANDENSKRLRNIFPGRQIDFGQNEKFYKTTGDMMTYLSVTTKSKNLTGVTFEFGTMDSQTSLGSIESLRRMVIENQTYHFNAPGESRKSAEKLLVDMFNPSQPAWWSQVSEQSQNVFDQILK